MARGIPAVNVSIIDEALWSVDRSGRKKNDKNIRQSCDGQTGKELSQKEVNQL
jgi:hypothetical protein